MPDNSPIGGRRLWLIAAVTSALVATTACSADLDRSAKDANRGPAASAHGKNGPARPSPGVPCRGAFHAPAAILATRAAAAGIGIYLPRARTAVVDDAWTCWGIPQPLYMVDGLQISYEAGWDGIDLDVKLGALSHDYGGQVTTINGYPAWVSPSTRSGRHHGILIVRAGTAIEIMAPTEVDFQRLMTLANSLDLTAPVAPIKEP